MSVVQLRDPLVSIEDLRRHVGMSRRWVEYRLEEGMPSVDLSRPNAKGKAVRRFRVARCEDWLRKEGWLKEDG
jgi:hypothetical protein